jgi:predicted DNA-binding transcriptional regulator AlpA
MQTDKLISGVKTREIVGLSRTSIWRKLKRDNFPSPVKKGGKNWWRLSDIQKYVATEEVNYESNS